jgi:NAD(P)-dependent dehydrogenase (short-subunit alcohol dehydrogenase family)
MTRAVLPKMLENGGSIINAASVLGVGGYYPGFASTGLHYVASKAGIIGLTRQLAVEYAGENIRTNVIAPAGISEQSWGISAGSSRRLRSKSASCRKSCAASR